MTHCHGYRAAAVSLSSEYRSIGIDAEPNEILPAGVEALVASKREQEELKELRTSRPQISWDRLLFSAKESVYKALFPLTRKWLDFSDVYISFSPESEVFDAHFADFSSELPAMISGRWIAQDYLLTSAVIEH
jgi:4'-phosphopantetheinyl transferase EntD